MAARYEPFAPTPCIVLQGSGVAVRRALHGALTEERGPELLFPEGTSQVAGPPTTFRIGGLQARRCPASALHPPSVCPVPALCPPLSSL